MRAFQKNERKVETSSIYKCDGEVFEKVSGFNEWEGLSEREESLKVLWLRIARECGYE